MSNLTCFKVLIVDSNSPAEQMLRESLSVYPQIGEVAYATSGEEALTKVALNRFDLIYMDANLPGLDGFDTCSNIRDILGYDLTPIILMSANHSNEHNFKSALSGCTSYEQKPVHQIGYHKLNSKVFALLEKSKLH